MVFVFKSKVKVGTRVRSESRICDCLFFSANKIMDFCNDAKEEDTTADTLYNLNRKIFVGNISYRVMHNFINKTTSSQKASVYIVENNIIPRDIHRCFYQV